MRGLFAEASPCARSGRRGGQEGGADHVSPRNRVELPHDALLAHDAVVDVMALGVGHTARTASKY